MDLFGASGWKVPTCIRSVQSVLFSLFLNLERSSAAALKPCSTKYNVKVNVFNATLYCHPLFKLSPFFFFFLFCHASRGNTTHFGKPALRGQILKHFIWNYYLFCIHFIMYPFTSFIIPVIVLSLGRFLYLPTVLPYSLS